MDLCLGHEQVAGWHGALRLGSGRLVDRRSDGRTISFQKNLDIFCASA